MDKDDQRILKVEEGFVSGGLCVDELGLRN
jgi:hypothetical protein